MEILAQIFQPSLLAFVAKVLPIQVLKYIGYFFLSFYVLWIFYLAIMNLLRAKKAGTLSKPAYILGLPILAAGVIVDVFCNLLLSIVYFEIPKQLTVTRHLSDNLETPGYKGAIARGICKKMLDTFDPSGCHCQKDSNAP